MTQETDSTFSITGVADPEAVAMLNSIHKRLVDVGLCDTAVLIASNLVGHLSQRMGCDRAAMLFVDWFAAFDRLTAHATIDGEIAVVKKPGPKRKKA